jgi:hypothetical protein
MHFSSSPCLVAASHRTIQFLFRSAFLADKKNTLTRETFFCALQTSTSLPGLCVYLLEIKDLHFVLPGKINSDAIEHRFGQYGQLAGSNYFLSVRQFLEAEKSIRVKSLVKYSKLSMDEIKTSLSSSTDGPPQISEDVDRLLNLLKDKCLDIEMTEDREDAIVYYMSGYIARGLLKTLQCQLCAQLVCESREMPPVLFCEQAEGDVDRRIAFLEQINRGGLRKPSDLLFIYCLHAHELQKLIFNEDELRKVFLSCKLPKAVFAQVLYEKLDSVHSTRQLIVVGVAL